MTKNFKIVKINYDYCNYLRQFDSKVVYNAGIKEMRPFIGILFIINDCEYFAPLSSPKDKHKHMKNNIDVIKLKNGELGVVNLNNMIPVNKDNYKLIELDEKTDNTTIIKWHNLLKKQLQWLNRNSTNIRSKANKLYKMYINNSIPERIKIRTCNFILLEEKCKEHKKD